MDGAGRRRAVAAGIALALVVGVVAAALVGGLTGLASDVAGRPRLVTLVFAGATPDGPGPQRSCT
jgi:hypothetical protein